MKDELKTAIKRLSEAILFILAGTVATYKMMNDLTLTIIYAVTVVWVLFVVYVIIPILSQI